MEGAQRDDQSLETLQCSPHAERPTSCDSTTADWGHGHGALGYTHAFIQTLGSLCRLHPRAHARPAPRHAGGLGGRWRWVVQLQRPWQVLGVDSPQGRPARVFRGRGCWMEWARGQRKSATKKTSGTGWGQRPRFWDAQVQGKREATVCGCRSSGSRVDQQQLSWGGGGGTEGMSIRQVGQPWLLLGDHPMCQDCGAMVGESRWGASCPPRGAFHCGKVDLAPSTRRRFRGRRSSSVGVGFPRVDLCPKAPGEGAMGAGAAGRVQGR